VFFGATGDLAYKKIFPARGRWLAAAVSACLPSTSSRPERTPQAHAGEDRFKRNDEML
jgi:hypothetical protein